MLGARWMEDCRNACWLRGLWRVSWLLGSQDVECVGWRTYGCECRMERGALAGIAGG